MAQVLRKPTKAALQENGPVVDIPAGTSRSELDDFVLAQLHDDHFDGDLDPGQEPVAAVYERVYGPRGNGPAPSEGGPV